jgi:hypothetical protein
MACLGCLRENLDRVRFVKESRPSTRFVGRQLQDGATPPSPVEIPLEIGKRMTQGVIISWGCADNEHGWVLSVGRDVTGLHFCGVGLAPLPHGGHEVIHESQYHLVGMSKDVVLYAALCGEVGEVLKGTSSMRNSWRSA